jgi:hypothetical protein
MKFNIASILFFAFFLAQANAWALTEKMRTCGYQPGMGMTRYTAHPQKDLCENKGTALVYSISDGALFICDKSEIRGGYYSAAGSSGFGKTTEGDRKTPVGKYSLGEPRASDEFGIFIPVGYPNASDLKKGRTGGDVGIHGPKRFMACAGALNVAMNWTAGCMAVASDQQILEIAEWVQKNPSANIYIE